MGEEQLREEYRRLVERMDSGVSGVSGVSSVNGVNGVSGVSDGFSLYIDLQQARVNRETDTQLANPGELSCD